MSKGLLPSFLPKSTVLQSLSFSLSLSTMANEEPADTAPEAAVPPPAGTKQHHYPEVPLKLCVFRSDGTCWLIWFGRVLIVVVVSCR